MTNCKEQLKIIRELKEAITHDWPCRPFGTVSYEERRIVEILSEILNGNLEKARQMIKEYYTPNEILIESLLGGDED